MWSEWKDSMKKREEGGRNERRMEDNKKDIHYSTSYYAMQGDTGIGKCILYRGMQGDTGIWKCTLRYPIHVSPCIPRYKVHFPIPVFGYWNREVYLIPCVAKTRFTYQPWPIYRHHCPLWHQLQHSRPGLSTDPWTVFLWPLCLTTWEIIMVITWRW